ncbi:MAG: DUF3034 domain-containing protein [Alphaproteobacteria bacterium HGW-Alphaproteobacteria-11]|nr:MAG: DUF3034 domain-containing protein [Alphaproteobacteria bacterium HGW-Alphaproteobacteria-11]
MYSRALSIATALATFAWSVAAFAAEDNGRAEPIFDRGRLLATGGASQVEGAGGGGLATWAMITGYGSRDGIGANTHFTYVGLSDFSLKSYGFAIGLHDRLELSYARQAFDTEDAGITLGLGQNFKFNQDIYGIKLRLVGDAVHDQDTWLPQISVGVQHKRADRGQVIRLIGGRSDRGTDFYAAASKLFLSESLLVNATLRATKANQFGLLGFGGDRENGYSATYEASAAYLLNKHLALGAEYRTKPDNLSFARENAAYSLFASVFPNKHISMTLAYVDLGDIALHPDQRGIYASLQAGF